MTASKKKFKLIVINISIVVVIFFIFSVIIYKMIRVSQYRNLDLELINNKKTMEQFSKRLNPFKFNSSPNKLSHRLTVILRNKNGDIVYKELPTIENYKENEKKLKPKQLGKIYTIRINDNYFRTVAFKVIIGNKMFISQLFIDINYIYKLMNYLLNILIIGGIIILVVSIGFSWYLAGKSMESIIESWKRQKLFVENASHELRTPLTIIRSKLELILRDPNTKIIDKYEEIEPALSETNRISKMVADLLTLARADSDTVELEKEYVNLKDILKNIIQPYKELGEIQGKRVSLYTEDINLYCDEGRIQQLFIILLDNSIKYTNKGENIEVKVFSKDGRCFICVKDEGIGIKKENKEKIFERFFREDKARSRESGGSGLGLSIAKWIVEKHNGTIEIENNIPKGTKILIKFRIKKE